MTKFEVTCRCRDCGTIFKRILRSENAPDPKCPKRSCRRVQREIGMDLAQPPPAIGGSLIGRAVDETAKITMQDHQLTDLKDNQRRGDIAAPKLPPRLQQQVDGFFSGGGVRGRHGARFNAATLGKQAMAGAFVSNDTPNPLAQSHQARYRPPIHTIVSDSPPKR